MARTGKIARLSREIRDELNRRLEANEPGPQLLAWLNGLPAVQELVAQAFNGVAISKQNLYEWRIGGFVEWQARRDLIEHARELVADAGELAEVSDGKLTDHLATVLAAQYAAALAGWNGEVTEAFERRLRILRALCQDVVKLRRSDQCGARLKMEQVRLDRDKEQTEAAVVEQFAEWLDDPAVREVARVKWEQGEERRRRLEVIFGMAPEGGEG